MSQSHCLVLLHVVFSTKDRVPFLAEEDLPKLHAYMAGIVRNKGGECYRVGGVSDHVHLAISSIQINLYRRPCPTCQDIID